MMRCVCAIFGVKFAENGRIKCVAWTAIVSFVCLQFTDFSSSLTSDEETNKKSGSQ